MEIKAKQHLAVWYQCPQCGAQSASTMLTPTKAHREHVPQCSSYRHPRIDMRVVERRYYTTFAIETTVSFTTIAGTLAQLGPFKICNIVHPNIRAFKKWVAERKDQQAKEAEAYHAYWQKIYAEADAARKKEQEEEALLKAAEEVAYSQFHVIELAAEQIASAVWVDSDLPNNQRTFDPDAIWFNSNEANALEDDHPF